MQTGFFDKTRLMANILMVVLVALNIWFSVQYTKGIKNENAVIEEQVAKTEERLQTSRFMKFYIDKVLGTNGTIAFEDRVKLEADVIALNDENVKRQWDTFVASQDSESAQREAVKLMSMLAAKML
jgi:hypothetical protein